ncbi:MAG: hypothetical protein V1740_00080, partial [Candidatus Woesearchaeota archaeon]
LKNHQSETGGIHQFNIHYIYILVVLSAQKCSEILIKFLACQKCFAFLSIFLIPILGMAFSHQLKTGGKFLTL